MLSICIPTYNRRKYLEKNLNLIAKYVYNNKLENIVEIVVSNNNSEDDTKEFLENFKIENKNLQMKFFNQKKNLKMRNNMEFVIENSSKEYFMWLGDDDYMEEEYLLKVLNILEKNLGRIIYIVPANRPVDMEGNLLKGGRDLNKKSKIYVSGFKNCLINALKAHQMSGLVFSRKVIKEYKANNINSENLYPQLYFSIYSSLRGITYSLNENPLKITVNRKRYWNSGEYGLLEDIFENYSLFFELGIIKRFLLESQVILTQGFRYSNKFKTIFIYFKLLKLKNLSFLTKVFLFPEMIIGIIYRQLKKILR